MTGMAPVYVYAGDGEDRIILGADWVEAYVFAGRGDDTVTVENGFTPSGGGGTVEIFGEDGDDVIQGN